MTLTVERVGSTLLAALSDSAVRALLLAAVMGGALALFRVRRTAWRLAAWTIVLWAALAMPALGRVLPAWRVPVIGLPTMAWLQPAALVDQPAASNIAIEPSTSAAPSVSTTVSLTRDASDAKAGAVDSTSTTPHASSPAPRQPSVVLPLLGLYLLGLVTLIMRAAIGWIAIQRLGRAAVPIDDAGALAQLARISRSAGRRLAPRIAESDRLHVPVTLSVTRPTVVLPHTWRDWNTATLEAVLTHEVAHVARRDALTQSAALFYRAIFWFSPLSWWLHHHLMDLAEQASDDAVLSAGTSQTDYARVLLEFFRARPQSGYRADWHVAMARGAAATAEARVDRILGWKGGHMRLTKSVVMIVVLAAAPAVVLTASMRPAAIAAADQAIVVLTPPNLASPQAAPPEAASLAVSQPAVKPPATVVTTPAATTVPIEPPAQPPAPQVQAAPTSPLPPGPGDFGAGAYRPGQGLASWPVVIRESKPVYSREAMTAGIQGAVELEVIILPDGTVGPMRITKSLDAASGLDNEAVRAARQWLFKPSQFNGQPVAAVVGMVLEFRKHDQTDPPTAGASAGPRPLGDDFANGAYFTIGTGMAAPAAAGDRGVVHFEFSRNPDGTASKLQMVGLIAPQIIQQVTPKYTPDGMRAKIQGQVVVEAIVMPDGTVGKTRVVQSLDAASGLDESALNAARQSTFTPGTLDGTPVPVLVTMTFYFRLH